MAAGQALSGRITRWLQHADSRLFAVYAIVAAFSTYFCMYAFRKPFTAAEYAGMTVGGFGYKGVLIAAQVSGYTLSKFIGIKVISEMTPSRRSRTIVLLIAVAEAALLLFALTPPPYNALWLFINGLPLGMVFGLVLSYLEGRQLTEALSAGLCASFILASGMMKFVGRVLIEDFHVPELWMPFLSGLIFLGPLLASVFLLSRIPQPGTVDTQHRTERAAMNRRERRAFFQRHSLGLSGLVLIYVLLTIIRSVRDDFGVEIWRELGYQSQPRVYLYSETAVMIGVVLINGLAVWIRNNRSAFLGALMLVLGGFLVVLAALVGRHVQLLDSFSFMVFVGLGMYVPYVAFHTTVFERLIAAFRERGNIGYLMYLADAAGYAGYIALMFGQNLLPQQMNFLDLFLVSTFWICLLATALVLLLMVHFARSVPRQTSAELATSTASNSL